ncbi:SPOR domain-containing protein [Acidovorax sp. PRC11]|uniref:SPOR domain-containing protein n=2 Tax=Pseudomonadota TaxID=1224 RepID=UPI002882C7C4|nr:SPOR domain-containing protein [Acidovorax sp. PRC11]MDT0136814.1 SPOR domain-containing protein [Acidovorax sp. PRC11]
MLRAAVLVLLLANAGYYAWAHGLLRSWGLAPAEQAEPRRLEQQIQPDSLRIGGPAARNPVPAASPAAPAASVSASAPASAAPAASAPAGNGPSAPVAAAGGTCLQAGPLDARQADALRAAAASAGLPDAAWRLEAVSATARWMVYMGRFADEDALDKKRAELRARKVAYDRPGAALEPGLSLGRFSTEEAAERALAALGTQGVRTARVVQERGDATGYLLRLPQATDPLRPPLDALRPALAGKPLRACG